MLESRPSTADPAMPTFKLTLAYDGTDFVGWQRQAAGVSIQGLLEDALRGSTAATSRWPAPDAPTPAFMRSGRSRRSRIERDADGRRGACARSTRICPTPSACCPPKRRRRRSTRGSTRASKTYRYRIWNGDVVSPFERRYAWHVPGALDVERDARRRRDSSKGAHDFAAFQTAGSDVATTEREILAIRHRPSSRRSGRPSCRCGAIRNRSDLRNLRHRLPPAHGARDRRHAGRESGAADRPPSGWRDVLASRDRAAAPARRRRPRGLFLVGVDRVALRMVLRLVQSRFTSKEP